MSSDSEPVQLYEHVSRIIRVIAHPDGERCITVGQFDVKIFSVRTYEILMEFKPFPFNPLTEQQPHAHPEGGILDAAIFNETTLMAITNYGQLAFWSLSNGKMLLSANEGKALNMDLSQHLWLIPLQSDHFVVIGAQARRFFTRSVAVAFKMRANFHYNLVDIAASPTLNVISVCNLSGENFGLVRHVSAYKNRFATAGAGNKVQVWALQSGTLCCLKVLRFGRLTSVSLCEKYILCNDIAQGRTVHIYKATTMGFVRKIKTPFRISSISNASGNHLVVLSNNSIHAAVIDIADGKILMNVLFKSRIQQVHSCFSGGTYLIVAADQGKVWLCRPLVPSGVKHADRTLSTISRRPPLQAALSDCLSGRSFPADFCDSLITYAACRASFEEWCSAHQILVLAVQNGDIAKSTERNGNIAHWFENLYLAVKDVTLPSEEDRMVAKKYLREAKQVGLTEGIEHILGDLHVTSAVNEQVRALHRAGIAMFEEIMSIEKRLDILKYSCERYRKYQLYSQCIGIALQIIPIVGGATAGVISAGASLMEGLCVKDVVDYAFGLGSGLTEGELSSFGDRVLGKAAAVLSPESVTKMADDDFHLMEEAVSVSGLTVEELRELFRQRESEGRSFFVQEIDGEETNTVGQDDEKAVFRARREVIFNHLETEKPGELEDDSSELENMYTSKMPSELKGIALKTATIETMEMLDIATVWAAFIVRFRDNYHEKFSSFRNRIYRVMEDNDLDGAVLVDRNCISLSDIGNIVIHGLQVDESEKLTAGMEVKIKQFLNSLQ